MFSVTIGPAWETRSSQDWRCLAREDMELWDVIVLTGEDGEASLGTGDEYGGGRLA